MLLLGDESDRFTLMLREIYTFYFPAIYFVQSILSLITQCEISKQKFARDSFSYLSM